MADSRDELTVVHLGRLSYSEGLELQEQLRDAVEEGQTGDTLLLLEHEPTYTVGRRSTEDELTMGADWYADRGIEVFETDRGGKVTYHAPGQLVGYPVMRVDDVVGHVRRMEEAIVEVNPHVRFVNLDDHGYCVLEVDDAGAQMEWWAISDRADRDASARRLATRTLTAGSSRIQTV